MHEGPAQLLMLVALAIIIAPTIAGWVRMPGIIGLVLAGALVGPYVLGLLGEGVVDGLGAIGLLYLMFQAGLEIDMTTFRRYRTSAVVFGLLTFAFPMLAGMAEGWFILGFGVAASILIGSIWASHTLVTLPDVREAGLSSNRAVTTTAGATIITDTLALVVLAVVTAEGGGTPGEIVTFVTVGLVVLALYCLVVLPWLGARFFRGTGQERALRFAFLLFSLASAGVLSEAFGIEGLVGAFLAGLGVNRLVPRVSPLMERVDFFGEALFVPAFLIYVGTKLDPAVVFDISTLEMALLFVGALVVGKGAAAAIGGTVLRFSRAETVLMFGMTVPQAAATLAATLVGARVGLFTDQVVSAVIVVVLVSILVGSVVTRRAVALVEMPPPATRPLGDSVLLGLPARTEVAPLTRIAAAVATGDDGHVMPIAIASRKGEALAAAERLAERAAKAAEAEGADVEPRVRYSGSYAEALLEAVVDGRASALVAPLITEGGLGHLFDSELERIGHDCPVPVIAVRAGTSPFERVVLALDPRAATPADRFEQRLAHRVAVALSRHGGLSLTTASRDESALRDLEFPEGTEHVFGTRPLSAHPELLVSGSVLIVPSSLVRHSGPLTGGLAERVPDVTAVIVAGPHRLRTAWLTRRRADYFGGEARIDLAAAQEVAAADGDGSGG